MNSTFHRGYLSLIVHCILIVVLACSCNNGTESARDDAADYRAYMERNYAMFNNGALNGKRDFIRKIDSFHFSKLPHSPHCLSLMHLDKSRFHFELHELDSATIFIDSAVLIANQHDVEQQYPADYIDILSSKGKILYAANRFSQAYNYYYKAKTLAEREKDTCSFQIFTYGLAMIAYKQKKYNEAADYFKRSYLSAYRCPEPFVFQLQEDLDNIALCYEKLHIYDSALYYYDSAISFILHHPELFSIPIQKDKPLGVIYGNMGGVLLAQGKTDSAISLLKKSYEINIQPRFENSDALLTHIKLAKAYVAKNNMPLLKQALNNIRAELDTIHHSLEAEANWCYLMFIYYENTHSEANAYRFFRDYSALRDSLWEIEKVQLQTDLNREFKNKEQTGEITMLQRKNEQNNIYLWMTIALVILSLAIIILIYLNYRRSKRHIRSLETLNSRINDQKNLMARTAAELKQSNLDKDRILHIVAHDLRNPVSASMMLASLIKETAIDSEIIENAELIMGASESALVMIAELLEFNSEYPGAAQQKKELADLGPIVKHSTDLLRYKAKEKNQTLDLHLPSTPTTTLINKDKISRVIANLVTNAIKFSYERATIHISLYTDTEKSIIEVRDSGIGIPDNYKHLIFEPFTNAKRHGTAGEKSFGLGLSICKQIVEANNGRIWFESIEGQGTSFFVALPVSKV